MQLSELYELLKTTGLPVSYDHFHNKVNPPFIAYRELSPDNFVADDRNYLSFKTYEIELCTVKKDTEIESQVEALLNIPYEKDESWDDAEKMYHIFYTI